MTTSPPAPMTGARSQHDDVELVVGSVTTETPAGRVATVTLAGVVCAGTVEILADVVQRLLRSGVDTMRFDLGMLQLCTSDAVEHWIELSQHLNRIGGSLTLANACGVVARALEAIGSPELAGKWS